MTNCGMDYQHQNLASGQWSKFSFCEQMANVGAEVGRAINWKKKENTAYSQKAFERALELLALTIDHSKNSARLKELTRLYEVLGDYFIGENQYQSSDELLNKYFYNFGYAASLARRTKPSS